MISHHHIVDIANNYDPENITIGILGGDGALDVCHGAKKYGFKTVVLCVKGEEKIYSRDFRTRPDIDVVPGQLPAWHTTKGCVDDVIILDRFADIISPGVIEQLRAMNTIFVQNSSLGICCDLEKVENEFLVPIFGMREVKKIDLNDATSNWYQLLQQAGVSLPKTFTKPEEIAPLTIEELVAGASINFNFFYSPLDDELEFMGTDIHKQTNLTGLSGVSALKQEAILKHRKTSMISVGRVAVTVKESLIEKAFQIGEKFIELTRRESPPGLAGPFALQGVVSTEKDREELVIFDIVQFIPESPAVRFTPYSGYLYGDSLSFGERIAMEIEKALKEKKLEFVVR